MSKITKEALERGKHQTLAEQLEQLRQELRQVQIKADLADLQSLIALKRINDRAGGTRLHLRASR